MKASVLYRVAAALLLLLAVSHLLGFRQTDPKWGIDALLVSMQSIHFDVQGSNRTYWDFFVAAGFVVGALYLFAAILAWQLGALPAETLVRMRVTVWAFALCFAAIMSYKLDSPLHLARRFLDGDYRVFELGRVARIKIDLLVT